MAQARARVLMDPRVDALRRWQARLAARRLAPATIARHLSSARALFADDLEGSDWTGEAFQFDRAGRLLRAPAYVAQAQLNNFYTSRLGIFIRGKSTAAEVQSIFGRFRKMEQRPDGFIGYYEIEVYNPFEDSWGRGRR